VEAFTARVLAVVRAIPPGRLMTYGDVAACAGRARAARAVGNVMRGCHDPSVPCHRVVGAAGRLGGYGGHESLKRQLLLAEGVRVTRTRIVGFARARWAPNAIPLPLVSSGEPGHRAPARPRPRATPGTRGPV
jgi:methylated-DNA-protein-cysteine methyltransferase-like protein